MNNMNNLYNIKNMVKQKQNCFTWSWWKMTVLILPLVMIFTACEDKIDDDKYSTFTDELVASYLEKQPELYSDFTSLLKRAGVFRLLNSYGTYTCFAPTNMALQTYCEEKGKSLDELTDEEIKEIAYNHLLGVTLESIDFPQGAITTANLNNRYLYIDYDSLQTTGCINVNATSSIIILDQLVHNGVIHTVNKVLQPSKVQLPDVIATDMHFSIFSQALLATGLADSLRMMEDTTYFNYAKANPTVDSKLWPGTLYKIPKTRKYGYTILAESDATYAAAGIPNYPALVEMSKTWYPGGSDDLTDRTNSLNRFVAYHLFEKNIAINEFVAPDYVFTKLTVKNTSLPEYIETMCPNTLLEIQTGDPTIPGYQINKLSDGTYITFGSSVNNAAANGIYHEINKILIYDDKMENDVLNKRIRMDIASFFPELYNSKVKGTFGWVIPNGYLKYMSFTEGSQPHYIGDNGTGEAWRNYQGDEFLVGGKYDFTLRTPPIPGGKRYEVRLGYVANDKRGVAQIYFDGEACGIPLDMRKLGSDAAIGWVNDNTTDDNGVENDKMMKNRGYMKGPSIILTETLRYSARINSGCIRRILITKTFDETKPHTIRFKSVEERLDRQFHVDYIEFVPSTYIEKEGRD